MALFLLGKIQTSHCINNQDSIIKQIMVSLTPLFLCSVSGAFHMILTVAVIHIAQTPALLAQTPWSRYFFFVLKLIAIYWHTHTHTHTHVLVYYQYVCMNMYVSIPICVYTEIDKHEFIYELSYVCGSRRPRDPCAPTVGSVCRTLWRVRGAFLYVLASQRSHALVPYV